jgi:4-hydroxymandelate oxidase
MRMDTRSGINLADFEGLARARMEPAAFDYFAGAAGDERTLADNRAAFDRVVFRPRVLVDTSAISLETELLGTALTLPVALAPTAFNRLADPDGETAAARAAGTAGALMAVSTLASCPLEEIAAAATGPLWFQVYVFRDRAITRELVSRAEAAGYRALVLTVDTPRIGRRERDLRNGFSVPPSAEPGNFERLKRPEQTFHSYMHTLIDPSLTWDAVDWLRSLTSLPILLKGVMAPDDATRAIQAGVSGLVVSNHGGRQLDGAMATLDALPAVADAVSGRCPVLLDGGVRRGADVLKALALGACAVLIGRPYLWGLAAAGEEGVRRVLGILRDELELAMALAGCRSIAEAGRALVEARR